MLLPARLRLRLRLRQQLSMQLESPRRLPPHFGLQPRFGLCPGLRLRLPLPPCPPCWAPSRPWPRMVAHITAPQTMVATPATPTRGTGSWPVRPAAGQCAVGGRGRADPQRDVRGSPGRGRQADRLRWWRHAGPAGLRKERLQGALPEHRHHRRLQQDPRRARGQPAGHGHAGAGRGAAADAAGLRALEARRPAAALHAARLPGHSSVLPGRAWRLDLDWDAGLQLHGQRLGR